MRTQATSGAGRAGSVFGATAAPPLSQRAATPGEPNKRADKRLSRSAAQKTNGNYERRCLNGTGGMAHRVGRW